MCASMYSRIYRIVWLSLGRLGNDGIASDIHVSWHARRCIVLYGVCVCTRTIQQRCHMPRM